MAPLLPMPGFLLLSIALAAFLIYLPYLVVAYGRFQVGYIPPPPGPSFPSCRPTPNGLPGPMRMPSNR